MLLLRRELKLINLRPDMWYCFRSGRFRPKSRMKHISVPPQHMTKSYIPDFNMISQHYRYKDTTSHTIGIQLPEYITIAEDTCLGTDCNQMPSGKGKTHHFRNHTDPGSLPGSTSLVVVESPRRRPEEGSS